MKLNRKLAAAAALTFAGGAILVAALSFADTAPIGTVSITGSGSGTVPIATTTIAGKVKVGAGLAVTTDGTLSVNSSTAGFPNRTTLAALGAGPTYKGQPIAPLATPSRAGMIKVGTGLSVLPDGTLNNTGVAGVASFKGRGGAVLPAADDYSIGQISGAAPVAITGSYADLTGKPALAPVATSGSYTDLTSKPSLAAVATSGSYLDLSNKPTIPAAQVSSDWNSSTSPTQILNKPTIPTALSQLTQSPSYRTVTDAEKATWNGNTAPVTSVFGRTGAVTAQSGDYTAVQVGADPLGAATSVQANLDTHTARTDNPHATTKAQVGLGSVDNTSDANKPVSTAQQIALNLKLDKTTFAGYTTIDRPARSEVATAAQGAKADTALQAADLSSATNSTSTTTPANVAGVKAAYDTAILAEYGDAISVANYAACDGSDESTGLQLAFTAAAGKALVFPVGKTCVGMSLTPANNTTILGYGSALKLKNAASASSLINAANTSGVRFVGLTIDNNQGGQSARIPAIKGSGSTNFTFEHGKIVNTLMVFDAATSTGFKFSDSDVSAVAADRTTYGVFFWIPQAVDATIEGSRMDMQGSWCDGVLYSAGTSGLKVKNNTFKGGAKDSTNTLGNAAVYSSDSAGSRSNIDLIGNTAIGLSGNCFDIIAANQNVNFKSNTLQGCGSAGAALFSSSNGSPVNVSVVGNTFINNGQAPINAGNGLTIKGVDRVYVHANTFVDNQTTHTQVYGVSFINAPTNVTVTGNTFKDNLSGAIDGTPGSGSSIFLNPGDAATLSASFGGTGVADLSFTAAQHKVPSVASTPSDGCASWASGVLSSTGVACGSGGTGMVYPSSGIPQSNGTSWSTSLGLVTSVGTPGSNANIPTEAAVSAALGAAGNIHGATGSTDGAVLLADGTGGSTVKGSTVASVNSSSQFIVASPALSAGSPALIVSGSNNTEALAAQSFNASPGPGLRTYGALGNQSSPSPIGSGTLIGMWYGYGWNGTAWGGTNPAASSAAASILMFANETHSTTAKGAYIDFQTTAATTTTRSTKARIHGSGGVSIGSTTDPGAGNVSVSGNITAKMHTGTIPGATTYGATTTIDLSLGDSPSVTLTGNPTLAFSNPVAGQWHMLELIQDATGGRTVTWPSSGLVCTWRNADGTTTAPTQVTTANSHAFYLIHTKSTTAADCFAR